MRASILSAALEKIRILAQWYMNFTNAAKRGPHPSLREIVLSLKGKYRLRTPAIVG
jgi:hypothetical protein